ncbi:hypothetical protein [Alteromonas facilis]|uniref:hypothetical protein n=1 Tax=Alteromonas facilis TaxID=2048004 RepID=UPI000C290A3F|nr:hypothetical protein [Alteromonas facilis]
MKLKLLLTSASVFLWSCFAHATNTSGVHGPTVNPQDKSAMYRLGYTPGEDGDDDGWAHRFHYQQAFNQDFRWRLILQMRDVNQELEYDYLRAELLWHFKHASTDNWDSGLRFDIRTRKGDRPEKFAINWTNQWQLSDKWRIRGILIGGWDFGGNANGGTTLETRASAMYKLTSGDRIGIEMFNEFGKLSDTGSFNEQEHSIGPAYTGKFDNIKYQLGYLAGVSDSADDHTFRLWLSTSF